MRTEGRLIESFSFDLPAAWEILFSQVEFRRIAEWLGT